MGLKKIFRSYRWRLFIPMVATTWIVVGVLAWLQSKSEESFRTQRVQLQLMSATSDILDFYDDGVSPTSYLTFFDKFAYNTMLENTRISVYFRDRLVLSRGKSVPVSMIEPEEQATEPDMIFAAQRSNTGEVICIAALPRADIVKFDDRSSDYFWLVVVVLLILCTVVCYLSTSYVTRNINMLHRFAMEAANGEPRLDNVKFSHDELGDIFREIVKLYNDKSKALATTNREHQMAMYAVEEKSRIKRQLTNNINHEIKTPVGVIQGYLDTVLSSPEMDEETRTLFLTRAHSNVIRLCNLLNDVSTMTRLEESGANIHTTEIDFSELVLGIETDLTASGVIKNMEFISYIPLDCNVRGNTNLLSGVISNLIRNAVAHSHGTKITLRFVVESEKFYTFSFADDGTGVDEEHLPHLFERFYRVDAGRSRKVGGTGLGLPIVKNAIEAMGGSISVHNRTNGGLEFLFTLEKWRKG